MENRKKSSLLSLLVIIFGLIALGITIFAITESTDFRIKAAKGAVLIISGSPKEASSGAKIELSLDIDTNNTPIQTVFINLIYPNMNVDLLSLDTSHSPFDIDAGTFTRSGYITLGRSTAFPTSGRVHIATLYFTTKNHLTLKDIQPVAGTTILTTENQNIYKQAVLYTTNQTPEPQPLFNVQFFVKVFGSLFKSK